MRRAAGYVDPQSALNPALAPRVGLTARVPDASDRRLAETLYSGIALIHEWFPQNRFRDGSCISR